MTEERRKNDTSERHPRHNSTALERHIQTVLTSIAILLLGWVGLSVQSSQVKISAMSVQIQNLEDSVAAPNPRIDDNTRRIEGIEKFILNIDRSTIQ